MLDKIYVGFSSEENFPGEPEVAKKFAYKLQAILEIIYECVVEMHVSEYFGAVNDCILVSGNLNEQVASDALEIFDMVKATFQKEPIQG